MYSRIGSNITNCLHFTFLEALESRTERERARMNRPRRALKIGEIKVEYRYSISHFSYDNVVFSAETSLGR